MDLQTYFDPLKQSDFLDSLPSNSFFRSINCNLEDFPDLEGAKIALIGLNEFRGMPQAKGISQSCSRIREKLFQLKKGHGDYQIIDLGDLKLGETLEDTIIKIKEVGSVLIQNQVLPIFFGGSHDLDIGQYLAYQDLDKLVSMLTVDAKVDMEEEGSPYEKHSQDIILHQPNFLFNFAHLAYQSYLVDMGLLGVIEKLHFDHIRLGELRSNFREIEPVIRDADLISFDVSAIQSADVPGAADAQPFGLTGEEACQICRFAGMNEKLSSFGIYGYNPEHDDSRQKTASIIATMIWYFIEGFYYRKDSLSFKGSDYIKYTVSLDLQPSTLVFYKSLISEKWWMEVPGNHPTKFDRRIIVPCSYQDYQLAQSGEIPERWINSQLKMY